MKPSRPSNMVFLVLTSIAVVLGLFVVGGFANQFLKQAPDINEGISESSSKKWTNTTSS
jgi:glutathione peroxidase-family protein